MKGKRSARGWRERLRSWLRREDTVPEADLPPDRPFVVPPEYRDIGRQFVSRIDVGQPADDIDIVFLRQALLNNLALDAVAAIAAELDVDMTAIPGGKGRKTQSLLQELQRREKVRALLDLCRERHPEVMWQPDSE